MSMVHRSPTFSNECGLGAFVSLGSLPRRKSHTPLHNRKSFEFHVDEDNDDQMHTQSDIPDKNSSQHDSAAVPFPCCSPSPSSPSDILTISPSMTSSRQPFKLSCGSSPTILLSNGKPLKSSVRSFTAPDPVLESQLSGNNYLHLRSRSEPSTPTVQTPKSVHFPETDRGLASIRVFSSSACPAAVSSPEAYETEDQSSSGFPFPKFLSHSRFEIDPVTSSVVPVTDIPSHANLLVESLALSYPSSVAVNPHLSGTILVRNLAYEKHVTVRFTLDNWQTVSEVAAGYVVSLPSLPSTFTLSPPSPPTLGDIASTNNIGWDRFSFIIHLENYGHNLGSRVVWLAAHYSTCPALSTQGSGTSDEWWDNNNGTNYRVSFRPASTFPSPSSYGRTRRETTPGPIMPSMVGHPSSTPHEHYRSIFVSPFNSLSNNYSEKISLPLKSGKLRLPNYAAPPVPPTHPTSSIPIQRSPSPPLHDPAERPTLHVDASQSHDYNSSSPASSTLSTPLVSPNMIPHMLINGHLANYARPGTHIDDWDPMAPRAQTTFVKQLSASDPGVTGLSGSGHGVSGLPPTTQSQLSSDILGLAPGSDSLSGNQLCNAFATRWWLAARGPLTGGDEGILA